MIRASHTLQGIVILVALHVCAASAVERDIVLLLNNAASMKPADAQGLAGQAVERFLGTLSPDASVAVLTFGESVQLAAGFTPGGPGNVEALAGALKNWDYSGPHGNAAAGVERAIYELKSNGRDGAEKAIVMFGAGAIDTGNPELDQQYSQWLSEILGPEARAAGIRIYAMDLSQADTQANRNITELTGGSYYRIADSAQLDEAFAAIGATLGGGQVAATTPTPQPQAPATSEPEQIEAEPQVSLQAATPDPQPQPVAEPEPAPPPPAESAPVAVLDPKPAEAPTPRAEMGTDTGQSNFLQWAFFAAATVGLFALTMVGLSIFRQRAAAVSAAQPEFAPDDGYVFDETGGLDATAMSEEILMVDETESDGVPSGAVAAAAGLAPAELAEDAAPPGTASFESVPQATAQPEPTPKETPAARDDTGELDMEDIKAASRIDNPVPTPLAAEAGSAPPEPAGAPSADIEDADAREDTASFDMKEELSGEQDVKPVARQVPELGELETNALSDTEELDLGELASEEPKPAGNVDADTPPGSDAGSKPDEEEPDEDATVYVPVAARRKAPEAPPVDDDDGDATVYAPRKGPPRT